MRERLHAEGAELLLARNRREIVRVQREICYALIGANGRPTGRR